jgi:hypothetical protein
MVFGNLNERPLFRFLRYLAFAAAAGAVVAVANALPGVDIPGDYDAVIVGIAVPALAAADKWLRSRMAP